MSIVTHKKEEVVTNLSFETTDGKVFFSMHEAQFHQDILDGKKKICPDCKGSKRFLKQKEIYQPGIENGGYPTSYEAFSVNCETCSGRGYLELKFS